MEKTKVISIADQVKDALDGRTQRWLSFKAEIPESDLSKKMNDSLEFTDEEIKRINSILGSKIKK